MKTQLLSLSIIYSCWLKPIKNEILLYFRQLEKWGWSGVTRTYLNISRLASQMDRLQSVPITTRCILDRVSQIAELEQVAAQLCPEPQQWAHSEEDSKEQRALAEPTKRGNFACQCVPEALAMRTPLRRPPAKNVQELWWCCNLQTSFTSG